jgi:glucokinase
MQNKKILTFDIGGTKIASALVEIRKSGYKIYDYQKTETPEGKNNVINKIIEIAINYERNGGFEKIGMAIAGQIDCVKDIVKDAPNISGFNNVNLKKIIKNKLGKNVEIDNDVKCFALAENRYGKSGKYKNAVYLAIGTGIGGAIEINNKLYSGADNIAGEFGHMVIVFGGKNCSCGNMGCWEQYVSGKAIENAYIENLGEKFRSEKKKAKDIALDSLKGIKEDKKVIEEISYYLSMGFVNIINTINPEIIIVGGGIVKEREILDLAAKDALKRVLIPARKTKIVKSDMEDEAFLVGAGLL